jgi:hypothetical protein
MNYTKASYLTVTLTVGIVFYTLGYTNGVKKAEQGWRLRLIAADFAEYNKRSGEWELRSMDDVVTSGIILGKGKLPEPPKVEPSLLLHNRK